jgi:transposase
MRRIKEILRLKFELGLDNRQIARSCNIPHSTVANYLSRAEAAGMAWPLPPETSEADLEMRLFPTVPVNREIPMPDFETIRAELLRHKHLTLELVWQEYKQAYPEGYQYSWFCELYGRWAQKLDIYLRQEHRAGERMFVDHAGPTVPVVDRDTGLIKEASIFVAVLGAIPGQWSFFRECPLSSLRTIGRLGSKIPATTIRS